MSSSSSSSESRIITNTHYELGVPPWGKDFWTKIPVFESFLRYCDTRGNNRYSGQHYTTFTPARDKPKDEEFYYETYNEVKQKVHALAQGMKSVLGIKKGDHVAMFSSECPEYIVISFACASMGCVFVPINENSSEEHIRYIVQNSDSVCAFISPLKKNGKIVNIYKELLGSEHIVVLDNIASLPESQGLLTYSDLIKRGESAIDATAEWPVKSELPGMDDLFVIMYTSGTTGTPKGVMLTHGNVTHGACALLSNVPPYLQKNDPWIYFNILPLSHIYGLAMCYVFTILGGYTVFFSGNRARMLAEVQDCRPNLFAAVPRVYEKIYDGIWQTLGSKGYIAKGLFCGAYYWKKTLVNWGLTSWLSGFLLDKIKEQFGGRMLIMLNGGAPISREIVEFMRLCITPEFYDGYGMTETTATGIRTQAGEGFDQIGLASPFYNYELKIASVPDMGYLASDNPPRGEMCLRSPACSRGYYKDPEASAKVFDEDGFVHTGDIVVEEQPGKVRIIDRLRNMFKLAQGEYVSGEAIESVLNRSPAISCSFIHGNSTQPYPLAIIVPEADFFKEWAPKNGLASIAEDMSALCKNDKVHEFIASEIVRLSKENALKGFEFVHKFHLHEYPFDEARDLVTSSLKLKRHVLKTYFKKELEELAASI